jgi:hypothetical protein
LRQLIAGNVDAALPSPAAYLNAVAQGHDLRWIFSYEYANVFRSWFRTSRRSRASPI